MTNPEQEQPLVFVMGPTGAGKSRLALAVAARLPVEIVSVDSALVYRGLDIGTAKPTPPERAAVRHHLLDVVDAAGRYSAAQFRSDARTAVAAIRARGRVPLLVGGTGLYFRALEHGLADLPDADPAVRADLADDLARHGSAALHARLAALDPAAAARIHPRDPQRILRALEVHAVTGRALTTLWDERRLAGLAQPPHKLVVAPAVRANLHAAIVRRFDLMLARGFVNEVRALAVRGDLDPACAALRTVGYREVWRHVHGELDGAQMRERAIVATRQLAKRQLTWLRREHGAQWFEPDAPALLDRLLRLVEVAARFQSRSN
ncbi:MAG: tRNA (adenosine(37)-N6)-dimethylallyltransferase MiaA [Gammaproteobacteria bacterium]